MPLPISTPPPAGLPPWWQDPPRSTALVPGAAAPAGLEPQPHRSGPAACCGAGGRGQAQEAAVSGLPGSAEGGGRGLTYPAASSASTKSLSLPGSQKGSSWAPSRPCPCCRALRAKDAALWSAEGHTRGWSVPAAGPGLFVETGLVMKHNLPRPQISDRCFKQNRGQRTRASCRQPEGRTGCPRAVWHPHVTATGATSRCWVCGRQRARLPTCPHTPQLPGGRGDRDRRRPLLKPSPDPRAPSSPNGQDTCPLGVPNPSRPLTTQTADTWTQPTAAPTVT